MATIHSTLRKATAQIMPKSLDGAYSGETPKQHPMDNEANQKVFRKLQEWWLQARESQSFVRIQMDIDDNFYHGDQYTQEDRQALEAVSQSALVFNKTKPVLDWIIGTERRTRIDYKVLPRKKAQVGDAQIKTDVMKYISDVTKAPFARSESFREAAISGLGWIEVGVRKDSTEDPIFYRSESWRNIWYDPLSSEKNISDARYLFRSKWTDLDIGISMFPDREVELRAAANSVNIDLTTKDDDEFYVGLRFSRRDSSGNQTGLPSYTDTVMTQVNNRRERVRLVECWYRMPTKVRKVSGGQHAGRTVNIKNQRMMWELNRDISDGIASVYDAVIMQVFCALFCENTLLQNMVSPYHHNRFPFVPIFAYRKGKFHEPYGVVRNCRDPQEDLNKRYSKALFLLSTNRLIASKRAVKDIEATREEMARPDGIVILDDMDSKFELQQHVDLAEEHVKLMEHDGLHIQEISGVTSENLGRDTNAISGRAVLAKQTQGSVVTAELFDNLRFSIQIAGELTLSLAEQFYDQPKAVRITGEKNALHWHDINQKGDDGKMVNDITATQMDFVVSEQDFRDTNRQAMFESLSDIVSKMPPELGIKMLDVVVDLTDFPGKQQLVDRIRKINGEVDPNAKLTPEQEQEQQQRQQQQQQQQQIAAQAIQLEFGEKSARIDKTKAEAQKIMAEIPGLGLEDKLRNEMEQKVMAIQKQANDESTKLQTELNKKILELANRAHEISSKASTEVEVANIKAKAGEEEASLHAAATVEVGRLTSKRDDLNAAKDEQMSVMESNLKELTGQRDAAHKESQAAAQQTLDTHAKGLADLQQERLAHVATAKKHAAETAAVAEKATADKKAADEKGIADKQAATEKGIADKQAAADKSASDKAKLDQQAKKDKADASKDASATEPQQPIVIHNHIGGDDSEVHIEKTPTGYVARKKPAAKK
jgi:hypothetical protein